MGHTKLTRRGINIERLTDKQRRFVHEYPIDYDGVRAVKAAGYKGNPKSLAVMAAKLLVNPLIRAAIGKVESEVLANCKLTKEQVIEQLIYCITRSAADFTDESGKLITDVPRLSRRAQCCIDGIEQEVFYSRDREGNVIGETVKTKLKLVGKAAAIDMGMKHLGQYAAEKQEVKHSLDFDALVGEEDQVDLIEAKIAELGIPEEVKKLEQA